MFNLDRPVHENESWSMFWPRPICPGHGDQDHNQRISLELDVSRGGAGSRRNVAGTFLWTKSINESSLNNLMYSMSMYTVTGMEIYSIKANF